MKPNMLQSVKGKFDFSGADMLVNKVLATGMKMYGYTLVWAQQTPAWMNTDANRYEMLSRPNDCIRYIPFIPAIYNN